jgi:membrane associated rhomboid family serine protease
MNNDPKRQIREFFSRGGCPATVALIAANVVTWLLNSTMGGASPSRHLIFVGPEWPWPEFWTALTWPLVANGHPLWVLFALVWAYMIGGSLERSWGTRRYAAFFFALALLTAATTWIGGRLLGGPVVLYGLSTAMAATTVAWALLNASQPVGLYFGLLQIPAIYLAYFMPVVVWFEVGPASGNPLLGLFALSGCAAAWWYVTQGRAELNRAAERDRIHAAARRFRPDAPERVEARGGFSPLRWWKDRRERQRLEDIMRRSGFKDDER